VCETVPILWVLGMQAVAERISADLVDVRLGCEVDSISWGSHGVEVAYRKGQNRQVLKADAVIVTVSLGVLKVRCRSLKSMRAAWVDPRRFRREKRHLHYRKTSISGTKKKHR
jgi:phytoene dehydrogenase-like protein